MKWTIYDRSNPERRAPARPEGKPMWQPAAPVPTAECNSAIGPMANLRPAILKPSIVNPKT